MSVADEGSARKPSRRKFVGVLLGSAATTLAFGYGAIRAHLPGVPPAIQAVGDRLIERTSIEGRIVFSRDATLFELSGNGVRPLSGSGAYVDPTWSPGGKDLAVVLAGTNHSDLVILGADGKLQRSLTQNRSDVAIQQSALARTPVSSP